MNQFSRNVILKNFTKESRETSTKRVTTSTGLFHFGVGAVTGIDAVAP